MSIFLRPILADLGVRSARELFRRTSSSELSLRRQAQIASIGSLYLRLGGPRGRLGFPVRDVDFAGPIPFRDFAGGVIECLESGPQCTIKWEVSISFLGFHCIKESNWDQSSTADEPFFLFGTVWGGGGNNTTRTEPYSSIDEGDNRFELMTIMPQAGPPPVGLIVLGVEHDWGTPEEAETKLRNAIKDIEDKLEGAAKSVGVFAGGTEGADSHVMPQWARDIYLGWFVEWGAAVFGLGDDRIGQATKLLFDYDKRIKEWQPLPDGAEPFGDNPTNLTLRLGGEGEGEYYLYFNVHLFKKYEIVEG